jgi:hypothetical protein
VELEGGKKGLEGLEESGSAEGAGKDLFTAKGAKVSKGL